MQLVQPAQTQGVALPALMRLVNHSTRVNAGPVDGKHYISPAGEDHSIGQLDGFVSPDPALTGQHAMSADSGASCNPNAPADQSVGADMAVVNYQEWQRGAKDSDEPNNGRVTTMVLGKGGADNGLQILQVHETWLPAEVVEAGGGGGSPGSPERTRRPS